MKALLEKHFGKAWMVVVYLFLYLPLFFMIVFSFNSTRQDAIDFLQVAAEVPVKTEVELFDLTEANETLQRLKRSEIDGAAVLKISE